MAFEEGEKDEEWGKRDRDMLARICGWDKRVPNVIKLPREEQPAAS